MPQDSIRVFAGDCTITANGDENHRQRGMVVVIVKPDNTVLIHDGGGYRPVEWATRADAVHCAEREDTFTVTAVDDKTHLKVECHEQHAAGTYPVSAAGIPVGTCTECSGTLVRSGGAVSCAACETSHTVPRDAEIRSTTCSCGLPQLFVERGAPFELCIDRDCESLDDAVRDRFDRVWGCPECEGDLRILRQRGLYAGCERYPDCDVLFSLPKGVVDGTCDCGLPAFETSAGRRCLDSNCEEIAS